MTIKDNITIHQKKTISLSQVLLWKLSSVHFSLCFIDRASTVTIKDNITIHQKIKKRKGKLGRYYSTISLSQLLLGPHASNIFGRLLRHIRTFLCVCKILNTGYA